MPSLHEIQPVGNGQIAVPLAKHPRYTVLPEDLLGCLVNDNDTMVEIVVRNDIPVRELDRQRRAKQMTFSLGGVFPNDLSLTSDFDDLAGPRVVSDQEIARLGELRIRGVAHRESHLENWLQRLVQFGKPMVADRADQDVPVGERGVTVG